MRYLILLIAVLSTLTTQAQTEKRREVGLTFTSFNHFGATYRFGNEKAVWRVNASNLSGNSSTNDNDASDNKVETKNYSGNLSFGREYRININPNLEFRYGSDIFAGGSTSERKNSFNHGLDNETNTQTSYNAGISLIAGFNYVFKDKLVVGVEILPSYGYQKSENKVKSTLYEEEYTTENEEFGFNISTGTAFVSLAYRW